jgi:GT2 family glycosyltransferase
MAEKIGLVTITFNSESVIDGFLDSVNQQDYPNFCLYIVDNDSHDRTLKVVEEKANPVTTVIIKNDFNNGVAAGNNQGIIKALEDGCSYIMLINNDTEFEPTLISKLYKTAVNRNYSVIAPKIMYFNDPQIIWFAGGGFKRLYGYKCYHTGMGVKDELQFIDAEITYAPTTCVLIGRSVFDDIGLMDEKYFVYFDDVDFFYRMMKYGKHKMLYISDVNFLHKEGSLTASKTGALNRFKFGNFHIRYTTRNRIYFLKKHLPATGYGFILWFWIRLNLRFLFSGKYNVNLKTWWLIEKSFGEGLRLN